MADVGALFDQAPFRWWVCGGHALELHAGRPWRSHDDVDVGVLRQDAHLLLDVLADWDVHVAAVGVLTPWSGRPLAAERSENNLWCRPSAGGPWALDVLVSDGDSERWIYRRDTSIAVSWADAVLRSPGGIDYLAPELQLLFKSMDVRPKDQLDFESVVPVLEPERIERLSTYLPADHEWQEALAST